MSSDSPTLMERQAEFQARVDAYRDANRSDAKGAKRKNRRGAAPSKRSRGKASVNPVYWIMKCPLALAVGAVSVVAGRAIQYHVNRNDLIPPEFQSNEFVQMAMVSGGDVAVAIVLSLILAWIFRIGGLFRGLQLAGFLGVMVYEPLAMEAYPEVWAQIYSQQYVAAAL